MCQYLNVPENSDFDDHLVDKARRAGGHRPKKEAVSSALEEYVRKRKQQLIIEAFGTVNFDPSYDYKAERNCQRRRRNG